MNQDDLVKSRYGVVYTTPVDVALLELRLGPNWREILIDRIAVDLGRKIGGAFLRSLRIHRCRRGRWWAK